jgi:heme exporter protein B
MLRPALAIAGKDLRLVLGRGTGLVQALLLGLLLIFVFSLAAEPGQRLSPQAAAAIFWMASVFCMVLVSNTLYGLEEESGARMGLLLAPMPAQAVWLGKAAAGTVLLLAAQVVFVPAAVVFLNQSLSGHVAVGLVGLLAVDVGLIAMGSLLGALAQGQAARESLLTVVLFPLLIPVLLAGIRLLSGAFGGPAPEGVGSWLGLAGAFDAIFAAAGLILFPFIYSPDE